MIVETTRANPFENHAVRGVGRSRTGRVGAGSGVTIVLPRGQFIEHSSRHRYASTQGQRREPLGPAADWSIHRLTPWQAS
jgi:hypothetical protein